MNTLTCDAPVRTSLEHVVSCFTRQDWACVRGPEAAMGAATGSMDAVILPVGGGRDDVHTALAALKPLGRLIVAGKWAANDALDRWLAEGGSGDGGVGCSVTARVVLEDGQRVFVAERWGDAGASPRRAGAHAGAYKMSRYKAYHQMQAAVARLVPGSVRDVIEIGDSNGVIRDMLGIGPLNYFRAHYPPHDLQTLDLIEDGSRDVFICDNTLEHVADPHAALRQMARVLRPGGWLVLFAPFIAMCQDDDRCRWSTRALSELLSAHFDAGVIGGWGNVDAACWYMRANKWLRVLRERGGVLVCRDSRVDGSPEVGVSAANDRLHPIHVWAVVRRAGGEMPPPTDARLADYAGLNLAHKPATAALAEMLGHGARVGVLPCDDGSIADRLVELGLLPTGLVRSAGLGTSALNRGVPCVPAFGAVPPLVGALFDGVVVNPSASGLSAEALGGRCRGLARPGGGVCVLGEGRERDALVAALVAAGCVESPTGSGWMVLRRSA